MKRAGGDEQDYDEPSNPLHDTDAKSESEDEGFAGLFPQSKKRAGKRKNDAAADAEPHAAGSAKLSKDQAAHVEQVSERSRIVLLKSLLPPSAAAAPELAPIATAVATASMPCAPRRAPPAWAHPAPGTGTAAAHRMPGKRG